MARERKPIEAFESVERKAKNKADEFGKEFTEGVNVLMLLHRKKDGGDTAEHRRRLAWYVTKDTNGYVSALTKLMILKDGHPKGDYRIYASANPRNVAKATRTLEERLLALHYDDGECRTNYQERLDKKWISCLMKDSNRDRSYFIWDIDENEGENNGEALRALADWDIIYQYKTKNGWHIITKPGNPEGIPYDVNRDGLLLLDY